MRLQYMLSTKQRVYLELMIKLQDDAIFNNGIRQTILIVLKSNTYTSDDMESITEMSTRYKKHLKTGWTDF